jgi:hypothetical protein
MEWKGAIRAIFAQVRTRAHADTKEGGSLGLRDSVGISM